jgi:hypothetical protein
MKDKFVKLPQQWSDYLQSQPETGMDYHVVTLTMQDGTKIEDVAIIGSHIIGEIRQVGIIREKKELPFDPKEIESIEVTHRKWQFRR